MDADTIGTVSWVRYEAPLVARAHHWCQGPRAEVHLWLAISSVATVLRVQDVFTRAAQPITWAEAAAASQGFAISPTEYPSRKRRFSAGNERQNVLFTDSPSAGSSAGGLEAGPAGPGSAGPVRQRWTSPTDPGQWATTAARFPVPPSDPGPREVPSAASGMFQSARCPDQLSCDCSADTRRCLPTGPLSDWVGVPFGRCSVFYVLAYTDFAPDFDGKLCYEASRFCIQTQTHQRMFGRCSLRGSLASQSGRPDGQAGAGGMAHRIVVPSRRPPGARIALARHVR